MSKHYDIHYVQQSDIDRKKWDACIDKAGNGLIYSYTYFLDCMAKHWDALVLNDYEAIMPLPWNKKYGILYIYQPAFTASLGVFGHSLDEDLIQSFIREIPKKFRLIEMALNHGNLSSAQNLSYRNNYVLDLKHPYKALYNGYRENIKRNIKKAQQIGCTVMKNIPLENVIALSKPILQKQTNVTDADYDNLLKLYRLLHIQSKAITYGVYSNNRELIASCAYFLSHDRAYYLLVGNHPNGKTLGASHYLIDRFIHDYAEQALALDFEGSDIRNLAFFYGSFGAKLEIYPFLRINNLPFWIKWAK
jgi:hypothetical protein